VANCCGVCAGNKQPLQGLPLNWLLQDGHVSESIVDRVGFVAGDKDERNAARGQDLGDRIGHAVTKIDVENGGVVVVQLGGRQRLGGAANRTDDGVTALSTWGMENVQRMPRGSHSNAALPPS